MNSSLYLCLLVAELPAQAMLRSRPELRKQALAVLDGEPPWEQVCSLNSRAVELGVRCGMRRAEVEMFSEVVVLHRSLKEESIAKVAISELLARLSMRIEDRSKNTYCYVLADITGIDRLFGPPNQILRTLKSNLTEMGCSASIDISYNLMTAFCAARAGVSQVIQQGSEKKALSPYPLSTLELSEEHTELFHTWGIHTLGQLAALPEKGLITRLGQEGKRLRQLARGELPSLFVPAEKEHDLEEYMDLDTPVDLLESLLFLIHSLLGNLVRRARTRALALASLTTTLTLEGGATHTRTLRCALPSVDTELLLKLLHLELSAHPPSAAIIAIHLAAESGVESHVQLGLFTPQLPEASKFDITLARLCALVGKDRVGAPVLNDTHRPNSFHLAKLNLSMGVMGATTPASGAKTITAKRILRTQEQVQVSLQSARPNCIQFRGQDYQVSQAYGPWLASGTWWDHSTWSLEQWDILACTKSGNEWLCASLERDVTRNLWQIEALYD